MSKTEPYNKFCEKCKKDRCVYYCYCIRTKKAFCGHDIDPETKFESEE